MMILVLKKVVSRSKIEIEKFNGKIFELWKLKLEDLLVVKEQGVIVDVGTTPMVMLMK